MVLDRVWKSYAKVNVFLKVVGVRDDYHELSSRFVRVNSLFDEIFVISKMERAYKHLVWMVELSEILRKIMVLEWDFGCELPENIIFDAWLYLLEYLEDIGNIAWRNKLLGFLSKNKIVVKKNIPLSAWMGWGSSNAGTFLKMMNEILELGLDLLDLFKIGVKVGADVNFFVADINSANVRGIGERIDVFEEEPIDFVIFTPEIACSTKKVFVEFRERFLDEKNIDIDFVRTLESMSSREILMQYDVDQLNDLFPVVLDLYPDLQKHVHEGWFLSGSGSTFFRLA